MSHLLHSLAAAAGVVATFVALVFGTRKLPSAPAPVVVLDPAPEAPPDPAPAQVEDHSLVVPRTDDGLTARAAMELVGHEAIVCEAYKDSEGIWTWGIGVTDASGHKVQRYIDNPQSVARCLEVFIWLLRTKYLPQVRHAFAGAPLSEARLAAALSFHYNTGAIEHATWVRLWLSGDAVAARAAFMQWRSPPSIVERRQKECDLFFNGTWSSDGTAAVIPVRKPSHQPDFRNSKRVNVMPALQQLLG